ncbi:MAG: DNA repair protein RecO [Desulfobacterales bacterium]|nr:DNA repair protein RecO [Desulfobacterales bacterium]
MSSFSTSAITLRRIDYGDFDLILTFFTLDKGKVSIIAKSAKKSIKRFSGILELFCVLKVVYTLGRGSGLPVLKEASLCHSFPNIRVHILKTAYASYWSELINEWVEAEQQQVQLYHLLYHVLKELDAGNTPEAALSIIFQIRFMALAGLVPNLGHCSVCHADTEMIRQNRVIFDLSRGGIVCEKCDTGSIRRIFLSKGTIKQLTWVASGGLNKAVRIRFAPQTVKEGLGLLEGFVPYHLGKEPRSLKFLRQIRSAEK